MRPVLAATLTVITLIGGCASAVRAEESTFAPQIAQAAATPVVKTTKQAGNQPTAVTVASRLSSMAVGSVVGLPICMVRRSQEETIIATKELVGDTKHKWLYAAAAPLGFLGGTVSGVFQGIVFAPYHAIKYSDQPFSKEVFSLGDAK